jgi:hypothetical protein
MKILFVGFNAKYINPTNQLIPRMLKLFAKVDLYGPGFVSDEELDRGLFAFSQAREPFDFIITTTQLAVTTNPEDAENFYRKNSLIQWGHSSVRSFMTDVKHYMTHSQVPIVTFVLDLDPYCVRADLLNQLDQFSDYIVAWGKGFSRDITELPYLKYEKAYSKKKRTLGLWHEFFNSRIHKCINFGHFVGVHEFDFSSTALRPYDVSVAGQLYYSREKTLGLLKRNKKLRVGTTGYRFLFSLLAKIGWSPYSRFLPHTIYRALFKQVLSKSKISMTDGAAYDAVIRKFIEIPASGALLLARPCVGFESLGFRDGESAVLLDENCPVEQVIKLLSDPVKLQSIAAKGQELVWKSHSVHARAQQMEKSLQYILDGRFAGSEWRDGEFNLLG